LTINPTGGVDRLLIEGQDQEIYDNCLEKYFLLLV
jgi:hypothetical protein